MYEKPQLSNKVLRSHGLGPDTNDGNNTMQFGHCAFGERGPCRKTSLLLAVFIKPPVFHLCLPLCAEWDRSFLNMNLLFKPFRFGSSNENKCFSLLKMDLVPFASDPLF
ncbi:hypothetical protein TNCV_3415911 [Trichonephila clavipes]|nr:hypothetical protein TNCV_3415911 [Trichonephila clavipes]